MTSGQRASSLPSSGRRAPRTIRTTLATPSAEYYEHVSIPSQGTSCTRIVSGTRRCLVPFVDDRESCRPPIVGHQCASAWGRATAQQHAYGSQDHQATKRIGNASLDARVDRLHPDHRNLRHEDSVDVAKSTRWAVSGDRYRISRSLTSAVGRTIETAFDPPHLGHLGHRKGRCLSSRSRARRPARRLPVRAGARSPGHRLSWQIAPPTLP